MVVRRGRAVVVAVRWPREPLINLVASLRVLERLMARRLLPLMAVALSKKDNNASDCSRPRLSGLSENPQALRACLR